MRPETIWKWAQLKGISVIGTGDFTHPVWFKELNKSLHHEGNGLFSLLKDFRTEAVPESCKTDVFFMLTAEISCIYSKNGRLRKVHSILFVPDFKSASDISAVLAKIGSLNPDGRPILGLDVKELLKIALNEAQDSMLVPAHIWTPHFSIFGANSGFDSIEECFDEYAPYIYAVETGLSSDPLMNRRVSALDKLALISNSDAHSPIKIGREATIFDTDMSYSGIMQALRTQKGLEATIEFFPEEGKYHFDGHRRCNVGLSPQETIENNYLCPACGKRVTVGVMHRVEKLADRERPKDAPPFYSLIPLHEIISKVLRVGANNRSVDRAYHRLLKELGSEVKILLDAHYDDIKRHGSALLAEAVSKMRKGEVNITPGYDGKYGKIEISGLNLSDSFDPKTAINHRETL